MGRSLLTCGQDLKFGGEKTRVVIGDGTTIREYATITPMVRGPRRVIDRQRLFLDGIFACSPRLYYRGQRHYGQLGQPTPHTIEVGDYAILGGVLPVHQFVKIGAHAMIGGGFRVRQDVCPMRMVAGLPSQVIGVLTAIGLSARGFKTETIRTLELVFKILSSAN